MIRKIWWKGLGVIILLYVFMAGLLVPLKPGIIQVSPGSAKTGEELSLSVVGYNSLYAAGAATQKAWLKLNNDYLLAAQKLDVMDDRHMNLVFSIPAYLPVGARVQDFALILDNALDGPSVLPSAVFVTQDSIQTERGQREWPMVEAPDLHVIPAFAFPFRNILSESIRNTYFHVPLWFSMIFLFLASIIHSIKYLRTGNLYADHKASAFTTGGVFYGILGVVTGAIWAKNTWGAYWSWDVKQNMTAIALLIYFAYFILRGLFEDSEQRARISAVYNIFAFSLLIPLIYIIPRMTDSLHPGAGGNPALGGEDLDNTMRMVFYPAIIGWTLIGFWLVQLIYRIKDLEFRHLNKMSRSRPV